MWKVSFWITFWCAVPYVMFYGFNRAYGIGAIPVLAVGTIIAVVLCWYVLFRSSDLPKIGR